MHKQFYAELEQRNTVQENIVELENSREYLDVVRDINSWGWGILVALVEHVNLEIVKEFYTNAKPNDKAPIAKKNWLR